MTACTRHRSILVRKGEKFTFQCQHCLKVDRKATGGKVWVQAPADAGAVPAWVDRFDDGERFLFDVTPEGAPEDVVARRSHSVVAESVDDAVGTAESTVEATADCGHAPYIAPLHGHVKCPACGNDMLDIDDVRQDAMRKKWRVECSWGCGMGFLIDPIPGVLDGQEDDEFRLRGVRPDFEGLTLQEAFAKSPEYVRALAKVSKRGAIRKKAAEFLQSHG